MTFTAAELRLLRLSDRLSGDRVRAPRKRGSQATAIVGDANDHGHWSVCVCECCGARFHRARSQIKGRVYCSVRCFGDGQRLPDALERKRACKRAYARRRRAAGLLRALKPRSHQTPTGMASGARSSVLGHCGEAARGIPVADLAPATAADGRRGR